MRHSLAATAAAAFVVLIWFAACSRRDPQQPGSPGEADSADALLEYVSPDAVSLEELRATELREVPPKVVEILAKAHELVTRGVGYRFDRRSRELTRESLKSFQPDLSCSEFVWYVFTLCGVDMGDHHVETREMAYQDGVYASALYRVEDGSIRPGDLLVYEYSWKELTREELEAGKYRSGHVVLVVSSQQRIVVGSHYHESTPQGCPTGAGYRRLLGGWERWTAGRTLRATYRLRDM